MALGRNVDPDLSQRLALSIPEAAQVLGVSERHLRAHVGEIPTVWIGERRLVPVKALADWLEDRAQREATDLDAKANEILASFGEGG